MKKLIIFTAIFLCGLMNGAVAEGMKDKNILIVYYSRTGNTKAFAEIIKGELGGDIFEIQTVQAYPEEYGEVTKQAKKEISEGYKPELRTKVSDISKYDTIFIGSPNWWGNIAPAVSSFLSEYDLSGKEIIPFITHGGGYVQNTIRKIKEECNGCVVKDGFVDRNNSSEELLKWLKRMINE